jgi:hypothetical protein
MLVAGKVEVISRPEFSMLLFTITFGGLLLMMGHHSARSNGAESETAGAVPHP